MSEGASGGRWEVRGTALRQGLEAAIGVVTIEGFRAGAARGGATGANVGDDATCVVVGVQGRHVFTG